MPQPGHIRGRDQTWWWWWWLTPTTTTTSLLLMYGQQWQPTIDVTTQRHVRGRLQTHTQGMQSFQKGQVSLGQGHQVTRK
eukprot:scaffold6480_cov165-Amphora_coffeaeformis.AAC.3